MIGQFSRHPGKHASPNRGWPSSLIASVLDPQKMLRWNTRIVIPNG